MNVSGEALTPVAWILVALYIPFLGHFLMKGLFSERHALARAVIAVVVPVIALLLMSLAHEIRCPEFSVCPAQEDSLATILVALSTVGTLIWLILSFVFEKPNNDHLRSNHLESGIRNQRRGVYENYWNSYSDNKYSN